MVLLLLLLLLLLLPLIWSYISKQVYCLCNNLVSMTLPFCLTNKERCPSSSFCYNIKCYYFILLIITTILLYLIFRQVFQDHHNREICVWIFFQQSVQLINCSSTNFSKRSTERFINCFWTYLPNARGSMVWKGGWLDLLLIFSMSENFEPPFTYR